MQAADGVRIAAYEARPVGKTVGAVVVIQEIFGVNSHIRSVADGYAAQGYLAVAPTCFQHVKAGVELGYSEADMGEGLGLETAVQAFAQAHPEVQVHTYKAHHGFNCDQRGAWDASSAQLARERSQAFFAKQLG